MSSAKGSKANPLTAADLPFTVPEEGRYWLDFGQLIELPFSPAGSVLAFEFGVAEPTGETE